MGQGYTRQDTGNNIADGNVIEASDLDAEFDAIVAFAAASTGHTHDGTTAEGGPVSVVGPAQEYVAGAADFTPKTDSVYDLGTTSVRWATGYLDTLELTNGLGVSAGGTGATTASGARTALGLAIGTDVQAYDAFLGDIAALTDPGADNLLFWDDSAGAMTFLTLGTNLSITGTTINAASGGAGGDAWGDVVDADIIPSGDSLWDLGNTGTRFASAFIDDLTLTNALPLAQGGTAATTASGARTSLGLGSLATASTINNSDWSGTDLSLANGGTGASLVDPNADRILFWDDSAGAMTFLTAGTNLTISGTTINASTSGDAWGDAVDAAIIPDTNATRDLGSTGTRFADAFITTLTLTNDLPVTDGGTGASTASAARTNLGLAIGTDVQAQDAGLQAIADATITGVSGSDADVITGTAGTSGNVATWNADGDIVDGGYAPGAMVFLAKKTASASATLDFTEFNSALYDDYIFMVRNLIPTDTGTIVLQVRLSRDGGSSYYTGGADYDYTLRESTRGETSRTYTSGPSTRIPLTSGISTSLGASGELKLYNPGASGSYTQLTGRFSYVDSASNFNSEASSTGYGADGGLPASEDGIRFILTTGTIASGSITMYGLRNS